ncbi:MAG: H+-translocating transhydrogenase subunit beta, partial [Gaiellales bacterium]|nr:H+-translocating transhydrogenase subunit beta [Gaiellales bacterium]
MGKREAFDLAYLACAAAFILGLKQLSSPRTAVRGNQVAAVAMVVVIAVTLADSGSHNLAWIIGGMVAGGAIGAYSARTVRMTAMPQMVALFNGVGGGAAALVAVSEFHTAMSGPLDLPNDSVVSILFSTVVGGVSFAGSMVAFGKLQELITGSPVTLPAQKVVSAVLFLAVLGVCVYQFTAGQSEAALIAAL